ncbi:hypothetical protein HG536_0A04260 [Torulaspora globosa]|uniref:CENP-C homolog n=1 Tax=Torulaspora globosa TaxID=48254 RepID=A0A7G3ZAS2_9SACH|nr:uncharacterized protein HG536_0A04260 [Torulaspora globosa]QLL30608.1 hypothetical protein HG536_0A04260 [Torulaspora globosa]
MDYMSLGIRSRKTGLNVKDNVKKDEYSMENIDDFFNDDDSSVASTRNKAGRRSTMLSIMSNNENFPSPAVESRRESLVLESKEFKVPSAVADSRRSTRLPQQYERNLGSSLPLGTIEEHRAGDYDAAEVGGTTPPAEREPLTYGYDDNSFRESPSIRLTPQAEKTVTYNKPPDLIEDDEDTRDFTSLNTSENALLEDELDDDYVGESEEDGDYVEGESILQDGGSSTDTEDSSDDSDSASQDDESDTDRKRRAKSKNTRYGKRRGFDPDSPTEVYDSDEEYIQSQAADLIGNGNFQRPEGVRRSSRVKVAPLEYWRNEKIVYKKKSDKPVLEIDKIITFDHDQDEEEERLLRGPKKQKKRTVRTRPYNYIPTGRPRGRPRKSKASLIKDLNPNSDLLEEIRSGDVSAAEWLKFGILEAKVNISKNQMSDQIIAFAPNVSQSEQTKETGEEFFSLEVLFDKHKDYFASGILKLPTKGKKKLSDSFNAFVTFFVIQGILEVQLAGKSFIITEGSSFQIPAFNEYSFENKGNNEVKMFFVQVTIPTHRLEVEDDSATRSTTIEPNRFENSDQVEDEREEPQQGLTSSSNMSMSEI